MDDHQENPVTSKPCISKVHVGLRNVKLEAYKPMVVSIGPYYHKFNFDLEAMQQNKKMYLDSLLVRRNYSLRQRGKRPESREDYLKKLANLETEARECYGDPMSTIKELCSSEFTEMMLLDSCFVVEFIRKMNYDSSDKTVPDYEKTSFDKNDPIVKVQWMQNQILRDMILLENQLPYIVLSEFYDMTKYNGEKSLEEMALSCFNASLPKPRLYCRSSKGKTTSEETPMSNFNDSFPAPGLYLSNRASKGEKINHLLHLVHIFCRPTVHKEKKCSSDEGTSAQKHDSSAKEVGKSRSFNDNSDQNCPLFGQSPTDSVGSSNENNRLKNHIRTVVELQEAGINFKKLGEVYNGELKEGKWNDYVSLFDIEFKRGAMKFPRMKVPCFKVDASTETLLRNLIAYEQQNFRDVEPKYFTDFSMLMNQLINSGKDAEVLRHKEIIINFMGDDEDVSQLFNTLIVGVSDSYKSYFLEVRENVDKHCKEVCKICLAYFKRNCFKDPCISASTIAATILLLLTVAQLIVALRN